MALASSQPEDPVAFVQDCLALVQRKRALGVFPVEWDTFLLRVPKQLAKKPSVKQAKGEKTANSVSDMVLVGNRPGAAKNGTTNVSSNTGTYIREYMRMA